jgi:hypothetical protein
MHESELHSITKRALAAGLGLATLGATSLIASGNAAAQQAKKPRGPGGPMFPPARTLFVAKSWSPGADPSVFFTTIPAALAQAATMTPVSSDPVAVIIFPGTYTENIEQIPSWVFLSSAGTDQNAVTISGTVTWTPTGAEFEVVQLYFLHIGATTVTTTEKTGGQTTFILHGCFVDSLTVNGRAASGGTRDLVFAAASVPGPGTNAVTSVTINSCLFEWVGGRVGGMTFNSPRGDCLFRIIGSTSVPGPIAVPWSVNGTSTGICNGSNFRTRWTLNDTASVVFAGCSFSDPPPPVGPPALEVAAGATADIRSSECSSFNGPGAINRRSLTTHFGPTTPGANAVTFAVPFPDGTYNVLLQLTAGPGNAAVTTSGKKGTDFTINDAVGGNTYDVTVVHD